MKRSKRPIVLLVLGGAALTVATGVLAQHGYYLAQHEAPQSYSAREDQAAWIDDPHVHQFYEATVEAFANGPEKVDRAAYEQRSRAIFHDLAVARGMQPEHLQAHLAAIPGEMLENVRRDPQILASYAAFIDALFGPQSFPAGAPQVGA